MPIEDGCLTDEEIWKDKLAEADEYAQLAEAAHTEWQDLLDQANSECIEGLGPRPEIPDSLLDNDDPDFNTPPNPLLVHEIERLQEEYDERLQQCLENRSDVHDAMNNYFDLKAAEEIAREEAEALKEAHDACLHSLNEGIPFA